MKTPTALAAALAAIALLAGCSGKTPEGAAPAITFAPWDKSHASKPDFAQVDHQLPIATVELAKVTPDWLAGLDQEQLDQLYARLSAGPIPDGAFDGRILLPRGGSGKFRAAEIVGGFGGLALHLKGLALEEVGESLWRGKVFYRNERILRNRIEDLAVLKKAGLVKGEPAKMDFEGKQTWLLFPAKLYCGQSLLDARRESIVIDYFFTDEIPGYQEEPDFLAGRRGLRVRDEIRMVRPGLYLGRAYLDKVFALNFVLHNKAMDEAGREAFVKTGQVQEDCWPGTQPRKLLATAG